MPFVRGPHNTRFEDFYSSWREAQRTQIRKLREALQQGDEEQLPRAVEEVRGHYDYYYTVKARADRYDVLYMLSPPWKTPLEAALMWVGGWRPTMNFQLLHALSGQRQPLRGGEDPGGGQLGQLEDVITPAMDQLSPEQLDKVADLRSMVEDQEKGITYRLAELQQSMGDEPMVSLAETQVKKIREEETDDSDANSSSDDDAGRPKTIDEAVDVKIKELEELLIEADQLRRKTLEELLDVLTVVQAAQYLLGAAHLDMVISKLGQMKTPPTNNTSTV